MFVRSARELFQLMYKLMKAKKKQSEQLEASPLPEEGKQPANEGIVYGNITLTVSPSITHIEP